MTGDRLRCRGCSGRAQLILLSSVTIAMADSALKRKDHQTYKRWLLVTVALGLWFLATQLLAWQQLRRAEGLCLDQPAQLFLLSVDGGARSSLARRDLLTLLCVLLRRAVAAKSGSQRRSSGGAVASTGISWMVCGSTCFYSYSCGGDGEYC